MRQWRGVTDKAYNLARMWLHYGSRASGPCVGCIAIWHHHVGEIVAQSSTGWIIRSGNDGHRIRVRERSLRGVIAFRS